MKRRWSRLLVGAACVGAATLAVRHAFWVRRRDFGGAPRPELRRGRGSGVFSTAVAERLACAVTRHDGRAVAHDLIVSVTTLPERKHAFPVMLESVLDGLTLPHAVYVTIPGTRPLECPRRTVPYTVSAASPGEREPLLVHLVRTLDDQGPVEKYLGPLSAVLGGGERHPRFMLILDDDHEYDAHLVEAYARALSDEPDVAFSVQSPASELKFDSTFPVVYGSRGVGLAFESLCRGFREFVALAKEVEPTCRVVDDIVVSAFLAHEGILVKDVPGFSFLNRPWQQNKYMHEESKVKRLRTPKRPLQNTRCHDSLVNSTWPHTKPTTHSQEGQHRPDSPSD